MTQKIEQAASYIKRCAQMSPDKGSGAKIGLVLGSGMGHFGDCLEDGGEIPYRDIPSFFSPGVEGHKGHLLWGKVSGVDVMVLQGRVHLYEGYSSEDVVLPVRTCARLGIRYLFLTNAAGGINPDFSPGDLVMVSDHLNMTGDNPLKGAETLILGKRFPDMTEAYNHEMGRAMTEAAKEMNYPLKKGVYAGLTGPNFETPAEINMLRLLGADMVGMSTVLECLAAHHMGVKVGAVSCISNTAARKGGPALGHEDVVKQLHKIGETFVTFLRKAIVRVNERCL